MRVVFVAYLILLTVLLLIEPPEFLSQTGRGFLGLSRMLLPTAHFLSFLVLGLLATWVRWPIRRWAVFTLLGVYGGATELLQAFVPGRTPDWWDWGQDLLGIAVAAALGWSAAWLLGRSTTGKECANRVE